MSDNNEALLFFAKTLAGHYSNLQQSQENPKDFAHINIFFSPASLGCSESTWVLFGAKL